jgi:hypothetical protein
VGFGSSEWGEVEDEVHRKEPEEEERVGDTHELGRGGNGGNTHPIACITWDWDLRVQAVPKQFKQKGSGLIDFLLFGKIFFYLGLIGGGFFSFASLFINTNKK